MNTFYWITRLDSIDSLLTVLAVVACITFFICLIGWGVTFDEDCYKNFESAYKVRRYFKKGFFSSLIAFTLFSCVNTFLPSTKDAYIIYGVGGTFDYLKSNEKAKELPDKVIEAANLYVDSQLHKLKVQEEPDSVTSK